MDKLTQILKERIEEIVIIGKRTGNSNVTVNRVLQTILADKIIMLETMIDAANRPDFLIKTADLVLRMKADLQTLKSS